MREVIDARFATPTRRIAFASGLIVVLVAITVGVVVLRFGDSADKYESALATQPSTFTTSETRTSLYDILNAARFYDAAPSPANRAVVAAHAITLAGQIR
jgi:hypothetical protein